MLFVAGSPVRLVIDALARPENFRTTTLVLRLLVLQTHRDVQRANVTFEVRAGSRSRDTGPARGRVCELPSPHGASPPQPMKHNLTLDHVRKEARDLLRGLQRRDPEALRRCHAIEPLTDLSNANLFYARFIIAREHGFSSWRKLKEHIENLRR